MLSSLSPALAAHVLGATAAVWAVMLPLATYLARGGRLEGGGAIGAGAGLVYAVGSLICHQQPDRTFHLWATPMPVCARCTGIYVGALAGLVAAAIVDRAPLRRPLERDRASRRLLAVAATPAVASLAYEWVTGHAPANWIRALTGVPLGAAVAWTLRSTMLGAPANRTDAVN